MNIILGSKNNSKERSIKLALEQLQIHNYTITSMNVESNVSSKPINEETIRGSVNRNINLLNYCITNNIPFDLLISIEGGYEQVENDYFIVTYASIITKEGRKFLGKSYGLQISQRMYEWVKQGNSLNKVIEEVLKNNENKKTNGISGFLTDNIYRRDIFDSSAVLSALLAMINNEKNYNLLEEKLKKKLLLK